MTDTTSTDTETLAERLARYEEEWLHHAADEERTEGLGHHMLQMLYRLPRDGQTDDMRKSIESMLADLRDLAARVAAAHADAERRDKELADYLAQMDRPGGGIYTRDFREGFRHALAMLAAYESEEAPSPDRVRPEVREAARQALALRAAVAVPEPEEGP